MKTKVAACAFSLLVLFSCSKKSSSTPGTETKPSIKITDVTANRETGTTTYRFYVNLTATPTSSVTVDYTTVDGSAHANTDYTSKSGTLTFSATQTDSYVDVVVTGDSTRKDDQQFFVQLSNPHNGTLDAAGKGTGTIKNEGTYLTTDNTGYVSAASYPGYHLAWSDEFDGRTLNDQFWNYETGGSGWGNNELENYTTRPQNLFLSNGNLIIEARKESFGGNNYTSARITTQNKKSFTYGRIDIRAKLPVAKGMWPALWMLGNNISSVGWPQCGETDIMELIGTHPNQVVGSLHWKLANGSAGTFNNTYSLPSGDFSQQFHVYSLVWDLNSIKILVDDVVYVSGTDQTVTSGINPFNNPFFLIFNVAVGGDWPGAPDASTVFPQRMFVDYVRVFQR
jgi:beta-glucanase (GH16 family)